MSRLWPPSGAQPKSLPDCDHQTWRRRRAAGDLGRVEDLAARAAWRRRPRRCGRPSPRAACRACRSASASRSGAVSRLESCQSSTLVVWPGWSTRGTTQPSSCLPKTSMFCEWSVAISVQVAVGLARSGRVEVGQARASGRTRGEITLALSIADSGLTLYGPTRTKTSVVASSASSSSRCRSGARPEQRPALRGPAAGRR